MLYIYSYIKLLLLLMPAFSYLLLLFKSINIEIVYLYEVYTQTH